MNSKTAHKTVRKTTATAKSSRPVAPARKSPVVAKPKVARAPAPAPAPASAAKPAVNSAGTPAPAAPKPKNKLVRDSFTIPKAEYALLEALKVRAANLTRPVKKSELLRAGIGALNGMSDKAFLAAVNAVPSLKTGRPSGSRAATVA